MKMLAEQVGWPGYLQNVPRNLEERIESADETGHITRVRPLTWMAGPRLREYVDHICRRHLTEQEALKIQSLLIPPSQKARTFSLA